MVLTNKSVGWTITLIILALTGLVIVQIALLGSAMRLKEQAFSDNVMSAMGEISRSLATHEALVMAFLANTPEDGSIQAEVTATVDDESLLENDDKVVTYLRSGQEAKMSSPVSEDKTVRYTVASPKHVTLKIVNPDDGTDTTLFDDFQQPGEYVIDIRDLTLSPGSFVWKYTSQSDSSTVVIEDIDPPLSRPIRSDSAKRKLVAQVFRGLLEAESEPIEKRLDSLNIDSIITHNLSESGIELDFAYGVLNEASDSMPIVEPPVYHEELLASDFRQPLFKQDIFAAPSSLLLYFPGHRAYIWGQLSPLLLAIVLFMLVITALFMYSIRTILSQKRMSGLLVDFINNMTHEFRTPISTIALATEAIDRPDISAKPDKVLQFNDMIRVENVRMRRQTDRILQMAALEGAEQDLTIAPVDLHKVIREAVASISLHVSERNGSLTTDLKASKHTIDGDGIHLSNIIHNLLDNANKYSPDSPQIVVRTFDSDYGVGVRVEDHGIGIKPEERKRVFDKYYRVSTGNIHTVKGFGLGLSYVKLIVDAHGGQIHLCSEMGEGTQVELLFPLSNKQI